MEPSSTDTVSPDRYIECCNIEYYNDFLLNALPVTSGLLSDIVLRDGPALHHVLVHGVGSNVPNGIYHVEVSHDVISARHEDLKTADLSVERKVLDFLEGTNKVSFVDSLQCYPRLGTSVGLYWVKRVSQTQGWVSFFLYKNPLVLFTRKILIINSDEKTPF